MGIRSCIAFGMGLALTGTVWAQSPAAPAQAASAPKPANAEAAAAMERAQRLAANPMRVIMQAGKIRRRAVEPDALPDAADPASLRRVAVRVAPDTSPAVAAPVAAAATAPVARVEASVAAPAPAPAPAAGEGITTSLVLQSNQLATPARTEVSPLQGAPVAPVVGALPKMVVPQALLSALSVQPKLVTMVEPDIPSRVMLTAQPVNEVAAELSLRADGTVAEVTLLPPVPRAWQPYIVEALRQWRYEPLPGARTHRVQLVFNGQ